MFIFAFSFAVRHKFAVIKNGNLSWFSNQRGARDHRTASMKRIQMSEYANRDKYMKQQWAAAVSDYVILLLLFYKTFIQHRFSNRSSYRQRIHFRSFGSIEIFSMNIFILSAFSRTVFLKCDFALFGHFFLLWIWVTILGEFCKFSKRKIVWKIINTLTARPRIRKNEKITFTCRSNKSGPILDFLGSLRSYPF